MFDIMHATIKSVVNWYLVNISGDGTNHREIRTHAYLKGIWTIEIQSQFVDLVILAVNNTLFHTNLPPSLSFFPSSFLRFLFVLLLFFKFLTVSLFFLLLFLFNLFLSSLFCHFCFFHHFLYPFFFFFFYLAFIFD